MANELAIEVEGRDCQRQKIDHMRVTVARHLFADIEHGALSHRRPAQSKDAAIDARRAAESRPVPDQRVECFENLRRVHALEHAFEQSFTVAEK